jgi:hypothetical protein
MQERITVHLLNTTHWDADDPEMVPLEDNMAVDDYDDVPEVDEPPFDLTIDEPGIGVDDITIPVNSGIARGAIGAPPRTLVNTSGTDNASGPSSPRDSSGDILTEEAYPNAAGTALGAGDTNFDERKKVEDTAGLGIWGQFKCESNWKLAKWLMSSGLSNAARDEYFDLPRVSHLLYRDESALILMPT